MSGTSRLPPSATMRRARLALALALAAALATSVGGGSAAAPEPRFAPLELSPGTATSANWAGFVVSGPGATSKIVKRTFSRVSGTWVQPEATCGPIAPSSAGFWVGIGGTGHKTRALEQIGSAADCSVDGVTDHYLWWELWPARAHVIPLAVSAGDTLTASVVIAGTKVTLRLANVTRGTRFAKTVKTKRLDRSSAEWIAETPADCSGPTPGCVLAALADFGTVSFSHATATSNGHTGTIADSKWGMTQVSLQPPMPDPTTPPATATVSELGGDGASFSVAWEAPTPASP